MDEIIKVDSGVICQDDETTPCDNEQGFEMRIFGQPHREVVDMEGIQLIRVSDEEKGNMDVLPC